MTIAPEMPADKFSRRAEVQATSAARAIVLRYVTENRAMPRGRKPDGEHALSNAERQARHRARHSTQSPLLTTPTRPPTAPRIKSAGRNRLQRWRDAVSELLALQAEYADWLAALPYGLGESRTAEALEAIVDLDLTALADIVPPRGYGRDEDAMISHRQSAIA
jgi:hypothetical protein